MLNIFKKKNKNVPCQFCKNSVDKTTTFVLKYKAADGFGTFHLCADCASYVNDIIDTRESSDEEDIY